MCSKLGYFRRHKDLMGLLYFDLYRPTDVCLVLLLAYTLVLHFLDLHWSVYVMYRSPTFRTCAYLGFLIGCACV